MPLKTAPTRPQASLPKRYGDDGKYNVVLVTDQSPVKVLRHTSGSMEVQGKTGGAGKVVQAVFIAETLRQNRVCVVAVAKTPFERSLAVHRDRHGRRVPFRQIIESGDPNNPYIEQDIFYVAPKTQTYNKHRDEMFSSHLWFLLQGQRNRRIRKRFSQDMLDAYLDVNQQYADVVNEVAAFGATVFDNDAQVANVATALKDIGRNDLSTVMIGHTAMPDKKFAEDELNDQHAMTQSAFGEFFSGIFDHDLILFSSREWVRRLTDIFVLLRDRRLLFQKRPVDFVDAKFPDMQAQPVPLDARAARRQAHSQQADDRYREIMRDIVGNKIVIGAQGRDEWYKNLDKFILAMEKVILWTGRTDIVCPLIMSPTRDTVATYVSKWQDDLRLARSANDRIFGKLGVRPFVIPNDGTFLDPVETSAWQRACHIVVTNAVNDGFVLMVFEPEAAKIDQEGVEVEVPDSGTEMGPQQVLSISTGAYDQLKQIAEDLGIPIESVVYAISPTEVTYETDRTGRPKPGQPKLELDLTMLAINMGDAIASVDRARRLHHDQNRAITSRVVREALHRNTPAKYSEIVGELLTRAKDNRLGRILKLANDHRTMLPGDAIWMSAHRPQHIEQVPAGVFNLSIVLDRQLYPGGDPRSQPLGPGEREAVEIDPATALVMAGAGGGGAVRRIEGVEQDL